MWVSGVWGGVWGVLAVLMRGEFAWVWQFSVGWYNIVSRVWCLLGFGLSVVCGLGRLFGSGDLRFGVDFAVGLVVVGD